MQRSRRQEGLVDQIMHALTALYPISTNQQQCWRVWKSEPCPGLTPGVAGRVSSDLRRQHRASTGVLASSMSGTPELAISLPDVQEAHERIRAHVHATPVLRCSAIEAVLPPGSGITALHFKAELFQKRCPQQAQSPSIVDAPSGHGSTLCVRVALVPHASMAPTKRGSSCLLPLPLCPSGSFKIRGACNAVLSLSQQEASKGVLCHSSGNHAAAVALAAKIRGVPSHIVVPHTTPKVKTDAVKAYGGAHGAAESCPSSSALLRSLSSLPAAHQPPIIQASYIFASPPLMPERLNAPGCKRRPAPPLCTLTTVGGGTLSGTKRRSPQHHTEDAAPCRKSCSQARLLLLTFSLFSLACRPSGHGGSGHHCSRVPGAGVLSGLHRGAHLGRRHGLGHRHRGKGSQARVEGEGGQGLKVGA